MMSYWKLAGLGLVVGGLAVSCTVSSDDDDNGAGGSPTIYTGGTGGTTTGTAGAAGTATTGGTGGTSPTAATDEACFNCLALNCTDYGTCLDTASCEPQLSQFRLCVYQRQHGLQLDQNGVAEDYGQAQQNVCIDVVGAPDPYIYLAQGVDQAIGCADNEGLDCQATGFVFP